MPFACVFEGKKDDDFESMDMRKGPLKHFLVILFMYDSFSSSTAGSEFVNFLGEKDWMKFVLKDFSNTAERTSNHGYYKVVNLLLWNYHSGNFKSVSVTSTFYILMILGFSRLGKVFVDGKRVNKAGTPVSDKAVVEIMAEIPKYVCRAGHKLEAAIEQLGIDVVGKVALDSGLSTGGFTDCLLQYGASVVYGVDVGYGQVADKIRRDERVSVIERTNLRYLSELPQNHKVDLVTLDLSFISILLVMPAVVNLMKKEATLVTLIKPQFEARRSQVGGGGIVRDNAVHQEVLEKIINGVESFGFKCKGSIESPLKGAEGNTEFLACFTRTAEINADSACIKAETSIDSGSETLA
ncbi:hypothetical protein RJ639_035980 [Escallonia herrerae]|uniref:Ribosomal RNA methyltransferase FtsJ domain-containing protein n=1 Tax=Escallonia herrerae TaxID=1293975 RepID=A0AA89B9F9_9ASTE|nr:hypothetical protein RJ639_035980 [Escallonia herrerae]